MTALHTKEEIRRYYEKDFLKTQMETDLADVEIKYSMIRPFLDILDLKNKHVLDIGCGMGRMLQKIMSRHDCIGIGSDISMASLTKNLTFRHHRVQADAENLPFRKSGVELVYFIDLIEHLPSPSEFLKNLQTVSDKILMFIPIESALLADIMYFLRKLRGKDTNYEQYGHLHRFDLAKIRSLIADAGFNNYRFKTVIYDNFKKYSSSKGKVLNFISKLCYRVSPGIHMKLFGGHTFIALCNGETKNV